ncbi:MAG: winged helix-turn-helix domain-containing protein [Lentisphaeria bacterium]|nr:winged helix-turn-helix domain-containing protein [Lentisphaeria bacterium]
MSQHPGCRANTIAEKLNIPLRTVQRHISELKKENKIEFKGAPKSGGYFEK